MYYNPIDIETVRFYQENKKGGKNKPVKNHLQISFEKTVVAKFRGVFLGVSKLKCIWPMVEDCPPWELSKAGDQDTINANMETKKKIFFLQNPGRILDGHKPHAVKGVEILVYTIQNNYWGKKKKTECENGVTKLIIKDFI